MEIRSSKAVSSQKPVMWEHHCFHADNLVLRLFVFVCSVLHSAPCQEILLWYLGHTEKSGALLVLRQLSGLGGQMTEVAPHFHFTPGSDGGAKLSLRDPVR